MIVRSKTQSVYYPVTGRRADAICGSSRILYFRGLVVVNTIRSNIDRAGVGKRVGVSA